MVVDREALVIDHTVKGPLISRRSGCRWSSPRYTCTPSARKNRVCRRFILVGTEMPLDGDGTMVGDKITIALAP